jgi:L-aspartate oxidase
MVDSIHSTLWEHVGILRDAQGLDEALTTLQEISEVAEPSGPKGLPGPAANAALTARLITEAARARGESRGAHFRSDFPKPRPSWRRHLGLRQSATPANND